MISMQKMDKEKQIEEVLSRGVSTIYPSKGALREQLKSGERLRIYLGADPTGPHLHLGHLTNLLTLKRLQKLGHKIIFLIGDFTARIGDPTNRMAPRKALSPEEIKNNMSTFEKQVARILSFSGENPVEVRKNSEWYEQMTLAFFIDNLLAAFSAQNLFVRKEFIKRIFEVKEKSLPRVWIDAVVRWVFRGEDKSLQKLFVRKDFAKRIVESKSIYLQEFIYPLLQGYDGVMLRVDAEVGGHDQIFNMNIGRAFRDQGQRKGENFFVATKLLVNPQNGEKLMNKSEGGLINLDDSLDDIFGKVMALNDKAMFEVGELCTEMPLAQLEVLRREVNPRDAKAEIAKEVVAIIYGSIAAKKAEENFNRVFSKREVPEKMPEIKVPKTSLPLIDLVLLTRKTKSKSEARRLILQGGVHLDGVKYADPNEMIHPSDVVLRIGKKDFFRVR